VELVSIFPAPRPVGAEVRAGRHVVTEVAGRRLKIAVFSLGTSLRCRRHAHGERWKFSAHSALPNIVNVGLIRLKPGLRSVAFSDCGGIAESFDWCKMLVSCNAAVLLCCAMVFTVIRDFDYAQVQRWKIQQGSSATFRKDPSRELAASRQSRAAPGGSVIEACFFDNFFILRGSLCLSFLGNFGFFMWSLWL
jgi:hypothetical protein